MPATEQTWRSQKLLHKIFAIGSLLLLIGTLWMFAKDHDREWKTYQRTARDMDLAYSGFDEVRVEAEKNEVELEELKEQLLEVKSARPDKELIDKFIAETHKGYAQEHVRQTESAIGGAKDGVSLQSRVEALVEEAMGDPAVQSRVEAMEEEIRGAYQAIEASPETPFEEEPEETREEKEIVWRAAQKRKRDALLSEMGDILARADFLEANLLDRRKMQAAQLDEAKSKLDLAVRDDMSTIGPQRQVDEVQDEFERLTIYYQQASNHREALQRIISEITAEERAIDKQIADNRAEMDQIAKSIKDRRANWIEGWWIGKKILESPILDAFSSPLQIENLWTEGLTHNYYNFKPVLRYDRCTTCHQAMEKTKPGSAVDPKYEPVRTLTFSLPTPTQAEANELLAAKDDEAAAEEGSDAKKPESRIYGFMLASEGVLNRDDVTIQYVREQSRAAKAKLAEDEESIDYLSAELIEEAATAAFEAEGARRPQFGLSVGDVIVEINGDNILSVADVRRKLLDTVQWGEPIEIKVRRGYPNPYIAHPRLDLFVGSTSPHKLQDLGCTVCHEGQGSATEFKWVSHTPNTLKERDQWRKEYGWFNNHHWIFPMYPERFSESSCLKCHHDVVELEPSERFPEPPAPELMAGYNAVRRYGCFGCHEIVGYDGPDKRVGPDLRLEPNYFAAGLQIAHLSQQWLPDMQARLPDAKAQMEQANEVVEEVQAKVDQAKELVADIQAEIKERKEAEESTEEAESELADAQAAVAALENDELKPAQQEARIAQAKVNMIEARVATLNEAIDRGEKLADEPYVAENRQRLLEILTDDQQGKQRFTDAQAAGEEVEEAFIPAFEPEAYDVALVLKDDETPGQFRKVGPSLRYVDTKLDQPFLDDWIRAPKHFRPSSRMPQFFRLFDHIQGESTDPEEREEQTEDMRHHTAELEDIEIKGIRTYLQHYSQPFEPVEGGDQALEAAKLSGDADRGKVLFEIGGCLACHSNEDFPNQGDQGPNLTGLGSKLVGEEGRLWLYGWIQNPKRYHTRTKMPVVTFKPLPGNEDTDPIADVVEYLLSDKKEDWDSLYANSEVDEERLNELALMHLKKTFSTSFAEKYLEVGVEESRRSTLKGAEVELLVADELVAAGEELSQEKKLLYIGSKSIGKYGCYACHDIPGFEGAKPIGTALSDWGRKDPSKLAFEHINHYVGHGAHGGAHAGHGHAPEHPGTDPDEGDHHGDAGHQMIGEEHPHTDPASLAYYEHELHHHSRVGFIHQKLKEPRSYDYAKLANKDYNDRLRMPLFPLDHAQHEQIITFVLGLVADPPPEQFVYSADERQTAINDGRKVLDRFNCAGCHELDYEEWTLTVPDNWDRLTAPGEPNTYPFLIPHVTQEEIDNSTEVSTSGRLNATISGRVKRQSGGQPDVYAWDPIDEDYLPTGELEEDEYAVNSLAYKFELYDPAVINGRLYMPKESLPTLPVDMVEKRIAGHGGDLASYLLPRVLDVTTPANRTKGEEAWGWVPPPLVGQGKKTNPDWLHSFLLDPHPIRPAAMLNMPKFNMSPDEATKLVNYFSARDNAEYPYQFDQRKRAGHLAAEESEYYQSYETLGEEEKKKFSGDRFADVMRIVTSQAGCVKCHNIGDYVSEGDPRAKGPHLSDVRRRLQPDYVRRWIAKPSYILPYTAMPELIKYSPDDPSQDGFYDSVPAAEPGGQPQLVPVYHGSSTEQLDALVDLLMNLDRYAEQRASIAELVPPPPAVEGAEGDAPAETAE